MYRISGRAFSGEMEAGFFGYYRARNRLHALTQWLDEWQPQPLSADEMNEPQDIEGEDGEVDPVKALTVLDGKEHVVVQIGEADYRIESVEEVYGRTSPCPVCGGKGKLHEYTPF